MIEGILGIFCLVEVDYMVLDNICYDCVLGGNWYLVFIVIYVGGIYVRLCVYVFYNFVEFKNSLLKIEVGLIMQIYVVEKDMCFVVSGGDEVWKKIFIVNFELKCVYVCLVLFVVWDVMYLNICKIMQVKIKVFIGNIIIVNMVDISIGIEGSGI